MNPKRLISRVEFWLGLFFLVAALPLVLRYFARLWGEPQYQYFPILLGVMAVMGWSRWREAPPAVRPLRRWFVWAVSAIGIGILTLAIFYQVPILAMLAVTLGLAVFGLILASYRKVENLFGLWCLWLLMLRPPWGYDEKMMGWLQALATSVSSQLLDLFGCYHLTEGNVLTFPGKTFFVDEACSGVISLRTMLAATVVIVVLRNRPLLHACLLIAAGLFWAGVMNVIRIGLIAAAHLKFKVDLSEGWEHEVTGLVVFAIATFGVLSTDALLRFILEPLGAGARFQANRLGQWWERITQWGDLSLDARDFEVSDSPKRVQLGRLAWGLSGVLGVLALLQLSVFLPSRGEAAAIRTAALDPAAVLTEGSLVPIDSSWSVVDFEVKSRSSRSVWGENSVVWTLERNGMRVMMSVDYFFRKWHELTVCYRASGWQLDERLLLAPAGSEERWQTVEGHCHRPTSRERGLMWFDLFRATGEVLEPVGSVMAADWKERFSVRNMTLLKGRFDEGAYHDVIQVQVFVVSDVPLEGKLRESVKREYEGFRDLVYQTLMRAGEKGAER